LRDQAQRAAVSIPANIAEGYGRQHRGEYLQHLGIAQGSLCELETHLIVAGRLKFISRDAAKKPWELSQRVGQMLTKLRRSLKNNTKRPPNED
jgi:four helix bundle protein